MGGDQEARVWEGGLIKLHLTTEERTALAAEAERRGITLPELVRLVVAKQAPRMAIRLRGVKSNGWHPGREAFLPPAGPQLQPPKASALNPCPAWDRDRIEAEAITQVICNLVSDNPRWEGTMGELAERLSVAPWSVKAKVLNLGPTLLEIGIVVSETRTKTARLVVFEKAETTSVTQKA